MRKTRWLRRWWRSVRGRHAIEVDVTGHLSGYVQLFDTPIQRTPSACVRVPRSPSGYSQFMTIGGFGHITVGPHVPLNLTLAQAQAAYRRQQAVAIAVARDDRRGIWIDGEVLSVWGLNPETTSFSADWRGHTNGHLEMIAIVASPMPG